MNMKKTTNKFMHVTLLIFLVIFSCTLNFGCISPSEPPKNSTITLTDMEGRSVTMNYPVERIVLLESPHAQELIAIGGESSIQKIVGWDDDFEKLEKDTYEKFLNKYPQMADIPDVGSLTDNKFNVEAVIFLKPDVVIMHNWHYNLYTDYTKDAIKKLELAGIPVFFVDFWEKPLENTPKSMLLLGQILGEEKKAKEIVNFYEKHTGEIYERLEKIHSNQPTVYAECAYEGPSVYGISYGDVAWGSIIKKVKGNNIAEPVLNNTIKPLSPEYIINKNPEIIVLTGRNWLTPGSVRLGYAASGNETKKTVQGYVNRPGWNTLNAVQNNKVYAIHHGFCFSIYNFVAIESFAKWFYPEEFKDLDPENNLKKYHDLFLPIKYEGTHTYEYSS